MKIVFDSQIFAQQRYGGITRYFYELTNRLACNHAVEVEIFAPLYVTEYFSGKEMVKPRGLKWPHLPRTGRVVRAFNQLVSQVFLENRRGVDVFHETYYGSADNAPLGAKRVVTVYDMIHERYPDSFPISDRTRDMKRDAVQRADHVICISENTRKDLIDSLGISPSKTSVVHLGYSLSGSVDRSVAQSIKGDYLLYVGQRGGYKNFANLLRAYGASALLAKHFSLVCFGGGGVSMAERELIQDLGLNPSQIVFIGGEDAVLAGLYREAAAFVYPSKYEGFGIPPLEAMSFECPVVCSCTSSIPEVVGGAAEMFDPDDVESMRVAIERVVHSQGLTQELVNRGRARIELFSWDRCASQTLDVYRRLLSD